MYKLKETLYFSKWLYKLKDVQGKVAILRRLKRVTNGNFGDVKAINENIKELRFTNGPGYRVYFSIRNNEIILLLIGGDKSSQKKDIEKAKEILKELLWIV